jgi:ParB-like chromosome segregation protein Spo0J
MSQNKHLANAQARLQVLRDNPKFAQTEENWGHQDEIVGILSAITESFQSVTDTHSTEYARVSERLGGMEKDIEHIKTDIASLCKVVRDGNGQPSLMQRLGRLEGEVRNNIDEITEVKQHANTIIAAKALSKSQVVAGLIGMIVTALLSTLALVATLTK